MTETATKRFGRYQLLDVIGEGGMGIVYRAFDSNMMRPVAIKKLKPNYAEDKELLARFHREVLATANLQHKNIVTVFTLDEIDGSPCMVMQYLEGQSIAQMIAARTALHLVEKIGLICQVCEGLQYAHEHDLIHRDIKPANILVLKDGTAKIVDFGIARAGTNQTLTQTGQIIGSVYYMSAEQIGGAPLDARTDIYSTGVTLYEFLTGKRPFEAEDPSTTFFKILNDPVPSVGRYVTDDTGAVDAILGKAMAKRAEDRYQTAEEFGFELSRLQETLKRGMTEEFLAQAQSAMDRKEWEVARQQLQEVLRFDRRNSKANELLPIVRQEIQRQQSSARIEQLRTQAEIALAGHKFDEALECIDQARRLDPADTRLNELYLSVQLKAERAREVSESIRRGQASFYAGDLKDAQLAVRKVLEIQADHTEGRALEALIGKELTERERQAQLKDFVEVARREIAGSHYLPALEALEKAQTIDPSDSNVRELINWAKRGYEQEKLRNELQRVTNEIGSMLSRDDYAEASRTCEAALQQFPEEPSLIKLQRLAKRQIELAARRRAVDEISARSRSKIEAGREDEAVTLLENALKSFPGEPNLEMLLGMTRAELERKRQEKEEREFARQQLLQEELAAAVNAGAREQIPVLFRSFSDGLARKLSIPQLTLLADRLHLAVKEHPPAAEEVAQHAAAMAEFAGRRAVWVQACQELESFGHSLQAAKSGEELGSVLDRARLIVERHPRDEEIRGSYQKIRSLAEECKTRREGALATVSSLVNAMQDCQDLEKLRAREKEVNQASESWRDDLAIRNLLAQASAHMEEVRGQKQNLLQELDQLSKAVERARSGGALHLQQEQARMLASEHVDDAEISAALTRVEKAAQNLSRQLEDFSSAIKHCSDKIAGATTLEEIEEYLRKGRQIPPAICDFEEVIDLLRKLGRRADDRRRDYERIRKGMIALATSAAGARGVAELEAIAERSRELVRGWRTDPGISRMAGDLDAAVQKRQVALTSSSKGEEPAVDEQLNGGTNFFTPAMESVQIVPSRGIPALQTEVARPLAVHPPRSRRLVMALAGAAVLGATAVALFRLAPGTVQVGVPAGVSIAVDGKDCPAPCRLKLSPGLHSADAQGEGYQPLHKAFSISSFQTEVIDFNMSKVEAAITPQPPLIPTPPTPPPIPPLKSLQAKPSSKVEQPPLHKPEAAAPPVPRPQPPPAPPAPKPVTPVPTPTVTFSVSQTRIQQGQPVQLAWATQNALDVQIDGGIGNVSPIGSVQVTPQQSTTYTLVAKGPGGAKDQSQRVEVVPLPPPPPPPPHVNADMAGVNATLERYRQAYENESLDDMKQAWPQIPKTTQKNMKEVFDRYNAIHLSLACPPTAFAVQSDAATVTCQQTYTYTLKGKKQPGFGGMAAFRLKKQGGSWVIEDVR